MKKKKVALEGAVRLNAWEILSRAVEEGVASGWRRAHKHDDHPGEETISECIRTAVMDSISEVILWDDEI